MVPSPRGGKPRAAPCVRPVVRFNLVNRRVHYWATAFLALPVLVVIGSGVLLQLKKQWRWVQPEEKRGTGTSPEVSLDTILRSVQMERPAITGWDDVNRIDLRPAKGVAKVWLRDGWEVQVDLGTGRVLQSAYRRSDVIEAIHDGSFFGGDWTKLGLFFPAGLVLFVMWLSGIWMFLVPLIAKRRRRRAAEDVPPPAIRLVRPRELP